MTPLRLAAVLVLGISIAGPAHERVAWAALAAALWICGEP